ncbi:MAG: hypothetical protein WC374_02170 [Phycisphaerae bacterium]|jgi:hypothetical protein
MDTYQKFARVITLLGVLFLLASICLAVDTRAIDDVRNKSVLNADDLKVIDEFVRDAIFELVNTTDFTQIARQRAVIVNKQSEQAQYAERYAESLRKYISQEFADSQNIEDQTKRHRISTNLMILVYQLGNPRLVDIAMNALDNQDEAVRYWAVKALTSSELIGRLNKGGNSVKIDSIVAKLKSIVGTSEPEVLGVMLDLAAVNDSKAGAELLPAIADTRIEGYANWTADASPVDMKVLKMLCEKLQNSRDGKAEYGRRFAQLYSFAIQRYIVSLGNDNPVWQQNRQQLASILVEIEDKCIGKLTGLTQTLIRRAVETGDVNTLMQERSRLLGDPDAIGAGEIPSKFGFDYGLAEDGSRLTQPRELAPPPNI